MKNLEFEEWDGGRLVVNREFGDLLHANGLATFRELMTFSAGNVAKNSLRERTTTRIVLTDTNAESQAFYLKRHGPAPWKEYLKPLLRLTRPMLGARHEWNAILQFHAAGISTMTPVALGIAGRQSFLLTAALDGCTKLSHWIGTQSADNSVTETLTAKDAEKRENGGRKTEDGKTANSPRPQADGSDHQTHRAIIRSLARVARTMHHAGLHHQDFYLTHLLVPDAGPPGTVFVIDLGRARHRRKLSRRWIVKDLAQLNYSATPATRSDRARFLRAYLGRKLQTSDRDLLARIERKSHAIARHSARHRL